MKSRKRPAASVATTLTVQEVLEQCAQQAPVPFAITRGSEHTLVYANTAFFRLSGGANGDALGEPIGTALSAIGIQPLGAILDRAFIDGVEQMDQRIAASTESERASAWKCSVWPVITDDGRAGALGIEIRESNLPETDFELQRKVAEKMLLAALRERSFADDSETARRRATFLAGSSRLLAETVDQTNTLLALTKLALPTPGSWCIVDVIEEDGAIHRLGIYHPDPAKQKLAQKLQGTWEIGQNDPYGAPAMLRDARTIAFAEDIEVALAATPHSSENLVILRQLGIGSLLTVPLFARKRLLGAITFVSAQSGISFSQEDVQLGEDLASLASFALDNAQVYDLALVLRRSAESANAAKTAFLSAMSHELRTPLNAIGGYIDLIDLGLRGPVTAEQHSDFARVKKNQQHLTLLITEILNFARVVGGKVTYAVHDVKTRDVMQQTVDLIEPLFGQKGIVFDGISGGSEYIASADPERVIQILVNLFSNAIKFTPEGGHISADCAATADTVTLRVSDTGIGVAVEKYDTIFEPFIQLKEGLADRASGVGLGLAISRDLARAMNGDLTVVSTEGNGARFTLTLPRSTNSKGPG